MTTNFTDLLADAMPQLVTNTGAATAIGVFVLMAIAVFAGGLFIYNQWLTKRVNEKLLNAPPQASMVQPLIVAMEEKFVTVPHFNEKWREHGQQLKEVRAYAHDEIHSVRGIVNALTLDSHARSERLASLEADSKTHTRALENMNIKLDRVVENVGNKVEAILQRYNGGTRS